MKPIGRRGITVILLALTAVVTVVAAQATSGGPRRSASARQVAGAPLPAVPKVAPEVFAGDVRDLPQVPMRPPTKPEFEGVEPLSSKHLGPGRPATPAPANPVLGQMPSPSANFAGLNRTDTCTGGQCGNGTPPDPNGEVGPTYYVQSVNTAYGIFDKATGARVAAFTENALFSNSGTFCAANGGGDPVVVYDALANRWILTHLGYRSPFSSGPFYQCIAVSRTGNPVSGGWYLYALRMDRGPVRANIFNDYPKFGLWTDCLYYSFNGFELSGSFMGTGYGSISRRDLYRGKRLTWTEGFVGQASDAFTMVPANLGAPDNAGLPPAGTPEYFVSQSAFDYKWLVRKFTAGPNCGKGGRLGAATAVGESPYFALVGDNVPQPPPAGGANLLESGIDRVMQKVQYRKVGRAESLWVVHGVEPNTVAPDAPQWAQINVTDKRISRTPVQQQIYTPDMSLFRWFPSIAADRQGNAAIAYSIGNSSTFPSIAYSGRLAGDPPNTLPQAETFLIQGQGSQTGNCGNDICHRWGDYSSISVDPTDHCTFWLTNEYYTSPANGQNTPPLWSTRVGAFKFPSCTPGAPPRCRVPRVTAQAVAKATKRIAQAHCSVGKVRKKASPARKKGRVLSQSPRPGARVVVGGAVNLTVGAGPRRR
jgi:hypothetical protein